MRHVSRNLLFLGAFNWSSVLQEEELYACQRGCRLFSICQFVRDSEDLNHTKSECESSKLHTELLICFSVALLRCGVQASVTCLIVCVITWSKVGIVAFMYQELYTPCLLTKCLALTTPLFFAIILFYHLVTSAACHEAYTQSDEQYACNLGCQNQLPFAERRQEQVCMS